MSGRSTACQVVSEVCQAIWNILGPIYVVCPSAEGEWLRVARDFEERWNMPHCVGAIDGKHVNIVVPCQIRKPGQELQKFFQQVFVGSQ
ncbi:unnamed protein product [Ixodes hexagonus]